MAFVLVEFVNVSRRAAFSRFLRGFRARCLSLLLVRHSSVNTRHPTSLPLHVLYEVQYLI